MSKNWEKPLRLKSAPFTTKFTVADHPNAHFPQELCRQGDYKFRTLVNAANE